MPARPPQLSHSLNGLLLTFGERLRLARERRYMTMVMLCAHAGISRMTLHRAENGSAAVTIGTYLRILSVLGLERDLDRVASKDRPGRSLQDGELPRPRRMVDLDLDD